MGRIRRLLLAWRSTHREVNNTALLIGTAASTVVGVILAMQGVNIWNHPLQVIVTCSASCYGALLAYDAATALYRTLRERSKSWKRRM